jgi:cobalt/nickel transport system ATP-binding protein
VTPLFDLQDVGFEYEGVAAIQHLTLQIHRGQRIALLGANGSGKSTLLRILDALLFASTGRVLYGESALREASFRDENFAIRFRREVALLFQDPDVQLFCPTVWDEVAFGPLQLGLPEAVLKERVNEAMDRFEIGRLAERSPHYLSGGEKKRVGLASLFVLDPAVILLDEPTTGLDPRSQSRLVDLLVEQAGEDKTIITATHDLHMVEEIADHCLLMSQGQVLASGALGDILADRELLEHANLVHPPRARRRVVSQRGRTTPVL